MYKAGQRKVLNAFGAMQQGSTYGKPFMLSLSKQIGTDKWPSVGGTQHLKATCGVPPGDETLNFRRNT